MFPTLCITKDPLVRFNRKRKVNIIYVRTLSTIDKNVGPWIHIERSTYPKTILKSLGMSE